MNLSFKLSKILGTFEKPRSRLHKALKAEGLAVDAGRLRFTTADEAERSFLLRRNTHRLEKGLSMPNRRVVFAVEFIQETVAIYSAIIARDGEATPSLRWSGDVLRAYFATVEDDDPRVAAARSAWRKLANTEKTVERPETLEANVSRRVPLPAQNLTDLRPYAKGALPDLETFSRLCHARRSYRWFMEKPVPMETVREAMAAALQAPSACNRQPFDFYMVTDKPRISEITALPLGAKGFGADLPCLVAVVGDLSAFAEPRDRHLIYIDSSLSAMCFMLALSAAGLASVPINWPDMPNNHSALRQILGLAPWQVPVMLIGLGYPDPQGKVPFSEKRTVDEVFHEV